MDIKCKNCGQMIDENDKYCKYCGYLIPQKEEEIPLSKLALQDKVQESKATIYEDEIVGSSNWSFADLAVVKEGDKSSLYSKSVVYTMLCILLGVACMIAAFLCKFMITNNMVALICLLIFMFAMIVSYGFALERYYNTKGLKNLEPDKITVKKYGFKKPAEVLIDGYVFELAIDKVCPVCEGDIIGDLHIEKIEKKIVVVCNINRKHIFQIDENAFVSALRNGQIEMRNKGKNKNQQSK